MTSPERYRISLRITHPNIDSGEIGKELSLAPKFSYTYGDRKITPRGNELAGTRRETFWYYELPASTEPIEVVLDKFTTGLSKNKVFLELISKTGGRVEFFIGWFSSGGSGFTLSSGLLKKIVEVGIELSFDFYTTNLKD